MNALFSHAAVHYAAAHPGYVLTVSGENLLRLIDLSGLSFTQAAVSGEYGYPDLAGTAEFFSTLVILVLAALGAVSGSARGWPAGTWLASCAEDGAVRLWDYSARKLSLHEIGPRSVGGPVSSVAFTPDGRYLATAEASASTAQNGCSP